MRYTNPRTFTFVFIRIHVSVMDEEKLWFLSLVMKFQMAQSLLIALYELNSAEMSTMLSVLPKNFQVCSMLKLTCVVERFFLTKQ